jgi:hypothetical protein
MLFLLALVEPKETYWSLLHNAPHWEFEFTVEAVTDIPAFFIGGWIWKRHHERAHQHDGPEHKKIKPSSSVAK